MTKLRDRVAGIKSAYTTCFGCGEDNPLGLALHDFSLDGDDSITARFEPRADYRGFSGMLHGGVVAAALDEILAWTAMLREDTYVLTGSLELKYRKPAPVDGPYLLRGTVEERRGRRLVLAGEMRHGDQVVASARGLFLASGDVPDGRPAAGPEDGPE